MDKSKSVITLTFGDAAENHKGMEIIGARGAEGSGWTVEELAAFCDELREIGIGAELYRLDSAPEHAPAAVLVIRKAINVFGLSDSAADELFEEQAALDVDKKAFMYGRVVNKNARWNLCFDDVAHEPDYEAGKGRVIAYKDVPVMLRCTQLLFEALGPKAAGLKGEGNYYYDVSKCGIGWHGDTERRKVVAFRLGASMPIHYHWFHESKPVGEQISVDLHHGDAYVMSEKAVGNDWKYSSKYTLRHCTGCDKFVKL